jgi:hypothetical protein
MIAGKRAKNGRPKMLRASDLPRLLDLAAVAKIEGRTASETLKSLARLLVAVRCDDRKRLLRQILDLFEVPRDVHVQVFVGFGIFPRKQKARKPRTATKRQKLARAVDLGPRRACRYGTGAYAGGRQEPDNNRGSEST